MFANISHENFPLSMINYYIVINAICDFPTEVWQDFVLVNYDKHQLALWKNSYRYFSFISTIIFIHTYIHKYSYNTYIHNNPLKFYQERVHRSLIFSVYLIGRGAVRNTVRVLNVPLIGCVYVRNSKCFQKRFS